MKRNKLTIQFTQNSILILYNKKLNSYQVQSVNNYKVINKDLFIEEMTNIIDINKINNHILTDNISIIMDNTYTNLDQRILESIFKELSFHIIEFINILDIIKIKPNQVLLDISKNIIKIYHLNKIYQLPIHPSNYKSILYMYLTPIIRKYNIKEIKIFGNYKIKPSILDYLSTKHNIKISTYKNPSLVPINLNL